MELLDELAIYHKSEIKRIELYYGDLTDLQPEEAVDILVVSAFPDHYLPTPGSLIGALYRKGISIELLAESKSADLRETCSCWLSQEIASHTPGIQFGRILCFEPRVRGAPPQVVGDIFRSLVPFLCDNAPAATVAMPLVASGSQGEIVNDMLPPLLDAAVHWMAVGLPLKCLRIVENMPARAKLLKYWFSRLKGRYATSLEKERSASQYDVFVSYSREDSNKVLHAIDHLRTRRPSLRAFIYEKQLDIGAAWQQAIFEALDACERVITVYSPTYLKSKVCQEEFNIALARHRESELPILFPIYLYSAQLPTYMRLVQYVDCREGDEERLRSACEKLLLSMNA
jgi:TIR domain